MDIRDIREIMGLSQTQVADELNVPRQEVIDCEENGETYLLLQYISAFPINPQILKDPDVDPFLPSFDQTTPGRRMQLWREENGIPLDEMAAALKMSPLEVAAFEGGEGNLLTRRRGEEIERSTGINRKWLMYGDGREKGTPSLSVQRSAAPRRERAAQEPQNPAPNREAGRRVKQARLDAGLSREQLAEMLDLSVSRISQMESGYIKDARAETILRRIDSTSERKTEETPRAAGLRLRDARKAAGLSVKEAAEIVQLKSTTLAHLESGYITSRHADKLIGMLQNASSATGHARFDPKKAGLQIKEERVSAGLSQKELATILRVPITRVSMMELGNVTEKETEMIMRRIHGQPLREIKVRKVKPTDQVILGSNIRDARIRAGLSQKALGDMLQLPQTKISLMERGKVDEPTARQILQKLETLMENRAEEPASIPAAPTPSAGRRPSIPIQPELGARLKEARLAAGLSQKTIAEKLGVSQGGVSYMEQGKVDEETLQKALQIISELSEKQE